MVYISMRVLYCQAGDCFFDIRHSILKASGCIEQTAINDTFLCAMPAHVL